MFYKGPSEDVFTWRGFFEPSKVTSSVRAKACPYRTYIQPLRGFIHLISNDFHLHTAVHGSE